MRVADGAMQIGGLTAFLQYLLQIMFAVLTAVFMFILIPRGRSPPGASARSSRPSRRSMTRSSPSARPMPASAASSSSGTSTSAIPGAEEPVLRELSFRAAPGETTAIVGSTGSGKSTLINLIPRFYDATGGRS